MNKLSQPIEMDIIKKDPHFMKQYQLSLIVSALLFFLISTYLYLRNKYSYWTKRGIKGPTPLPLFGNMLPVLIRNRWELEKELTRTYGKVYGIYQGWQPRLVVGDAELIRQITVKDFDTFPNHEASKLLNKYQKEFIIFLQDHRWKRVRGLLSPTFTSGKIKRMYKLLDACADDLVDAFDEARCPPLDPRKRYKNARPAHEQNVVNLKQLFSLFTMDAISTCCYGLKLKRDLGTTNLQVAASRNEFIRIAYKLFNISKIRFFIGAIIPKSLLVKLGFTVAAVGDYRELANIAEKLIASRRAQLSTKKLDDYMQILLEASSDDKLELDELDKHENHHAGLTHESLMADQKLLLEQAMTEPPEAGSGADGAKGKYLSLEEKIILTDGEMVANAMFLLAVGLETTASLLTACVYALAFHQDVQNRLHEELSKIAQWNEKRTVLRFEYDSITTCQYLDATISESLRYAAPVLHIDRASTKDYYIEKYNLHLPKDSKILLNLHGVMNDEDYWPDSSKFNPDRFMPGQKEKIVPGSYCPFGMGPRHCLGMRFSLTEAKLALAKLLMHFRFEPAPNRSFPPTACGSIALAKMDNPFVHVTRRES